jgi:hypothetical protein
MDIMLSDRESLRAGEGGPNSGPISDLRLHLSHAPRMPLHPGIVE